MIIFQSRGRLGNNIFQYAFAQSIAKENELIVCTGMKDFLEVFEKIEKNLFFFTGETKFTRGVAKKIINIILLTLVKLKVISSYIECSEDESKYITTRGFFLKIKYISGYFQRSDIMTKEILSKLKIKNKYIDNSLKNLQGFENRKKIFFHIRRGDFVSSKKNIGFSVNGESAELPFSYYKEVISLIKKKNKNVFFFFISDDVDFVKEKFSFVKNKKIVSGTMAQDFTIATLCDGGVLSASTFSYCASMIAVNVNKASDAFYAPKYWLGFARKQWHRSLIQTLKFQYIDV